MLTRRQTIRGLSHVTSHEWQNKDEVNMRAGHKMIAFEINLLGENTV